MLVQTETADYAGTPRPFDRIMFDQDTGGAIRAAGRGDIYMGVGAAAEVLAGNQYAEGTFYYFVLKPENVDRYKVPVVQRLSESIERRSKTTPRAIQAPAGRERPGQATLEQAPSSGPTQVEPDKKKPNG
jgi:hypothetical protein